MIQVFVFLLGLLIGSFLNVCIYRLPIGRSIVFPSSRCTECGTPIAWYDNVPLASFLVLRGKCRSCGRPISWRYPAVELMNALCMLWSFRSFGSGGEAVLVMVFCAALIVVTFIDLDHQIIPDAITLPGMLTGLALAPLYMSALADPLPLYLESIVPADSFYARALLNSLIGLVFGAAPLLLIGWAWERIRHVEAMGGGDIKLMGMVGSFLGWKSAFLTIMLGAISGSLAGGALILLKKQSADNVIPFGPFLAGGAAVSLFYGGDILHWYLGLLQP